MKLKRLGICFVLLVSLLTGLFTGCQSGFQPGTYTDDAGRTVAIDQAPQRIVSFGPSITEILFALNLEERVVGVSAYSDYPEAAALKPKVGDAFNPSLEKIAELEPDLVLTVKQEQLNRELDSLGLNSVVIDPEDIDGIFTDIELVGEITGTGKEAGELIMPLNDGLITRNHIRAEIGELVSGSKQGRGSDCEITLFKSVGIAIQDLAAACRALSNAEKLDLGEFVSSSLF